MRSYSLSRIGLAILNVNGPKPVIQVKPKPVETDQFGQIDVVAVYLRDPAIGTVDLAAVDEERAAHRALILHKGSGNSNSSTAGDQHVAADRIRIVNVVTAIEQITIRIVNGAAHVPDVIFAIGDRSAIHDRPVFHADRDCSLSKPRTELIPAGEEAQVERQLIEIAVTIAVTKLGAKTQRKTSVSGTNN